MYLSLKGGRTDGCLLAGPAAVHRQIRRRRRKPARQRPRRQVYPAAAGKFGRLAEKLYFYLFVKHASLGGYLDHFTEHSV